MKKIDPKIEGAEAHDQLLMKLMMTLTRVSRAYTAACDSLAADFGLTQAVAWPAVMISRLGDGVRPGEVAEALHLEPSSVVRVIDQLILAGLVERQENLLDRRAKALSLTPDGRNRVAQIEGAMLPFRRQLLGQVPKQDLETCLRILETLQQTITPKAKQKQPAAK